MITVKLINTVNSQGRSKINYLNSIKSSSNTFSRTQVIFAKMDKQHYLLSSKKKKVYLLIRKGEVKPVEANIDEFLS